MMIWVPSTTLMLGGVFLTASLSPMLCHAVKAAPPAVTTAASSAAAAVAEQSAVILAAGDIADCDRGFARWIGRTRDWFKGRQSPKRSAINGAARTAIIIKRHPEVPVLALGDLAYSHGTAGQFKTCYDRYWGFFRHRTWPAPGNHEYRTQGASGYYGYWRTQAGPPGRGYYSFNLKPKGKTDRPGWHIVALNSEVDASPGSRQARWLRQDLTRNKAPCVLAFFHRPAFSSVNRSGRKHAKELFQILYAHGASIVLTGHNHFYERTAPLNPAGNLDVQGRLIAKAATTSPRGIVSFIVGTGGAPYAIKVRPAKFSRSLLTGSWGVLKLELLKGRYRWDFIATNKALVTDKGVATCVDRTQISGK